MFESFLPLFAAQGIYSHASALIIGVSRYSSTKNKILQNYDDLVGVRESVRQLQELWVERGFGVRCVVDREEGDRVTRAQIIKEGRVLAQGAGRTAGRDSLLIVHLIGHGPVDGDGGLLLSDARLSPTGRVLPLTLRWLASILLDEIGWTGCNVLVLGDFCNSGALVPGGEGDIVMQDGGVQETLIVPEDRAAPVRNYARQMIASSLRGTPSYLARDESTTQFTSMLIRALGRERAAFKESDVLTAVELRRQLQLLDRANTYQATVVGRIWTAWSGQATNEGDIQLFKEGNGVVRV